MEYLNFQQEKDVILWSLINETFGKNFAKKDRGPREEIGLELYITPKCNQNCSYCYLCKYGNELYPPEIQNENVILENLEIMLNHCLKNNWNPFRFDFFTGEIWDTEFGYKVYEVTEKAIKNGFKPNILVIPTNMSFLLSDKAIEKAEHFMEVCKSNGVKPCYSCSNDGFLIDLETRPLNSPNDY